MTYKDPKPTSIGGKPFKSAAEEAPQEPEIKCPAGMAPSDCCGDPDIHQEYQEAGRLTIERPDDLMELEAKSDAILDAVTRHRAQAAIEAELDRRSLREYAFEQAMKLNSNLFGREHALKSFQIIEDAERIYKYLMTGEVPEPEMPF